MGKVLSSILLILLNSNNLTKANSILETVGNTPHVRINKMFNEFPITVWLKLERANPGGSIKDRIALAMIEDAAKDYARRAALEEGILLGISSGATIAAIAKKAPELPEGSMILAFCYDTGERYLSVEGFLADVG